MRKDCFFKLVVVIAGFSCVASPLAICAQSITPSTVQLPGQQLAPAARPTRSANLMDDFAGLAFTDDQKTKIRQVHEDFESRRNAVIKDEKLDADQRAAMLQGYHRMEYREIYDLLTPDQQAEVRKKVQARRAMEQREKQHSSAPK